MLQMKYYSVEDTTEIRARNKVRLLTAQTGDG